MGRTPKLVEVFKDYKQILIKGASGFRRYPATYKLVKVDGRLTFDRLLEYVGRLQRNYPDHGFELKVYRHNGKTLYVVTRKSYVREGNKIRIIKDRVPIYFDLEEQRIYVPKSYIRRNKRLTNYVLMRALGALGLAKVKYVRMGEP